MLSQVLDNDSSVQTIWISQVDGSQKSIMGMTFKSLMDAKNFYDEYGKAGGFETRSSSMKLSVDRELTGKSFICAKECQTQNKANGIKRIGSPRTNCKVIMWLALDRTSKMWIVKKFIEEHNHAQLYQHAQLINVQPDRH